MEAYETRTRISSGWSMLTVRVTGSKGALRVEQPMALNVTGMVTGADMADMADTVKEQRRSGDSTDAMYGGRRYVSGTGCHTG